MPLNATVGDGISKAVAVPSRLYDVPCPSRPLAGMRISIKDNMDLAGIKTTLMNRAYAELYGPARLSAAVVDNLLSLGAVVVGKTKLAAFASAQEPTGQWVDYHCPFNPRADGYQHPGGSSTGAAAAVAGYPWLDFSIGTDSRDIIPRQASANYIQQLEASEYQRQRVVYSPCDRPMARRPGKVSRGDAGTQ